MRPLYIFDLDGTLALIEHRRHLLDVPATLRRIADDIERGEFGQVNAAALVLDAFELECFFCGSGETGPNAHLLFHAGAAKMMAAVLGGKG